MISDLQIDFDLTDEGDVEAFLGIKFQSNSKGEVTMSQPGIIDAILEDVSIQTTSKNTIPPPLHHFCTNTIKGAQGKLNGTADP